MWGEGVRGVRGVGEGSAKSHEPYTEHNTGGRNEDIKGDKVKRKKRKKERGREREGKNFGT